MLFIFGKIRSNDWYWSFKLWEGTWLAGGEGAGHFFFGLRLSTVFGGEGGNSFSAPRS